MNRSEEIPHWRNHFRLAGKDESKKIKLVESLRKNALQELESAKTKIRRPMSDFERALYEENGISTEWNLSDCDDAIAFAVEASMCGASLSPSHKSAAALLSYCSQALRRESVPDFLRDWILDAFAGLDLDATQIGRSHRAAQTRKAIKPRGNVDDGYGGSTTITKEICRLAVNLEHRQETASQLWPHLFSKLEELGLEPEDGTLKSDIDFSYTYRINGKCKSMSFRTFSNTVSRCRGGKVSR